MKKVSLAQYWGLLVTYLRPQWPKVVLLTGLLFAGIGLDLLNPQILRGFIDTAQAGAVLDTLTNAALLYLALVFISQLVNSLAAYISEDVGWTATNNLRINLTLHCLKLDLAFHKAHTPGELLERIDGDIAELSNFFSQFVIRVLGNLLLLVGTVGVVCLEDWRAGLGLAIYAGLVLLVLRRVQTGAVFYSRAYRQTAAETSSFWEEQLGGLEDIITNGAENYVMARQSRLLRKLLKKSTEIQVMGLLIQGWWKVLTSFCLVTMLTLGTVFFYAGQLSLGTVYLFYSYTVLLSTHLSALSRQFDNLQRATASIERVAELYHTTSTIQQRPDPVALQPGGLGVRFEQVSFGYVKHTSVLKQVSFKLEAGQVLGVVGRTGSGKTSLTRLLFRFYDPDKGQIFLGDSEVRDVRLDDLRQAIGIVTQEVQLFKASVRDNLTFWDRATSDEQILAAFRELGLWDWYSRLPEGLDTELSGGSSLSAGEAQLLAFTRIFLKDPRLVILDEASSRLDPATEQLIERAVDRLLAGRTAIIIAHRLATLKRADRVLVLENGQVCEEGGRVELSANPTSRYYQMLQTGLEEVAV
jgi:ABC-type multidrug transport system fused ATPase/permease subunit